MRNKNLIKQWYFKVKALVKLWKNLAYYTTGYIERRPFFLS